jgi:DNA mismatch endonuclease, patch repair protein
MSRVRRKGTEPELVVRKTAHRLGFRFVLHRKDLAGYPDIVFPKYRAVIFVHGCFWHRHGDCRKASIPKTRRKYWTRKFERNVARDAAARRTLRQSGWRVLTIWECQARHEARLARKIKDFLDRM